MSVNEIDEALAPVAQRFSRYVADELLDFREAAHRADPGQCVRCYFRIYGSLGDEERAGAWVAPLRNWLERHLEIVAQDHQATELERLPVRLDRADLESYCRQVMAEIQFNRAYSAPAIRLSFRFKSGMAAPAA